MAHVLTPKHCGAEGHQHDHSRRTVEAEHGGVYPDAANLQQKASALYSDEPGFVQLLTDSSSDGCEI
jgi:hypothetical protein